MVLELENAFFNSDPSKPAQELLFSRKKKVQTHPTISINNIQVERASSQTPSHFT